MVAGREAHTASARLRVAVLVSGTGTTLFALDQAIREGRMPAEIVVVASDRPDCPALSGARERGLPVDELPGPKTLGPTRWEDLLSRALRDRGSELVVLAGFLRILSPTFVRAWEGRIINLHPSLLPKHSGPGMYGARVHAAVLASGDPETGASVHIVTTEVDRGPVVAQTRLPVRPGETPEELASRLRPLEHELVVHVVAEFARGRIPLPYRG
jgi:phosphoribosylglycinamide formyltransferase 1